MRLELCEPDRRIDPARSSEPAWSVIFQDGSERRSGDGTPRFTFCVPTSKAFQYLLATDVYSAATAFIRGKFDVKGDLEDAIRFKGWQPQSSLRKHLFGAIARCVAALEGGFQTGTQAARNIRFHYDRSNEFYRLFLDPRMVYSCAYFRSPDMTLEDAQVAKLNHICHKLDLQPGERFLDVGCGWGALIGHAAVQYGAAATGCTLSRAQYAYAVAGLDGRVRVLGCDYRELGGRYDKIASVGMFEHVGRRRAHEYFRKMADLLAPNGLFLNHAIARPQGVRDDAASLFVRLHIFPGGQLIHLWEMIRAAEDSGFEVLDVENLRPHYALTCRRWEQRLAANRDAGLLLVDEPTFRAWRLWLAASALSFEDGFSSVYQVLMSKRGAPRRRLTRENMYSDSGL
ncbi:MAG: cyclopropane-fatty-acyl-phospholipid synthase family protein [Bryobacteraceae bacterium]|jgi:cyclopropane-fatty-acyl-phospholipid synthase